MRARLPALTLPAGIRDLRHGRGPRVLVTLHDARCAECARYVERILAARDELAEWSAEVLVVSPAPIPADSPFADLDVPLLVDAERSLASDRLGVVVADEWGEVYFASEGGSVHDAIEPAEVVDWVRFVAIQCPECEAPEGGWRDL